MTDPHVPGPAPATLPATPPATPPSGRAEIKVRKNGSLLVTGDFVLLDHEGHEIPRPVGKPNVALCRCGHSARKPFCDRAHKACGFVDPPDVPAPAATATPDAPAPPANPGSSLA